MTCSRAGDQPRGRDHGYPIATFEPLCRLVSVLMLPWFHDRVVKRVWNDRDYQAAADLYSDGYVNAFGSGPSARAEPVRRYHAAFPDLHLDVEELVVAGDTVVVRLTFRGTDTGGYLGRPPSGRAVEEWIVSIMHFEGDRVVREWTGADKLGLFIQLGVLDDPWPRQVEVPAPTR